MERWLTFLGSLFFLAPIPLISGQPVQGFRMDTILQGSSVRHPSRDPVSCAVLIRLALGGAWIGKLGTGDILCPPQMPDVCYWILADELLTRDEAFKRCADQGLVLWLPESTKEEDIMKLIMHNKGFRRLNLRIEVVDRYTIGDMRNGTISHESPGYIVPVPSRRQHNELKMDVTSIR
ncbi:hypothetical protein EG68_12447 [Paragonimus skrjabini miyazakii]|uniref:C-type lectin domain-containing protein n=1 Tax=Paragonimus skrjabini miyazakii TaxID=59628 RepID=A0A8S9YBZ9_9TREM|nr:hypothetical protein EG68_12447 [Paragonimus skrjabini miyazakii]